MPPADDGEKKQDGEQNGAKPDGKDGEQKPVVSFATRADFQAEVERILGERLERAERKKEREITAAQEKAEADALEKNKEFEALSVKQAKQIDDLKGQITELEKQGDLMKKYEKVMQTVLDEKRQGVPEHLLTLLDEFDPIKQLEYIAANADKLKAPAEEKKETTPVPETPKAGEPSALTEAQRTEQSKAYAVTLQRRV